MDIGQSEAETFWTAFLRKLARRGRGWPGAKPCGARWGGQRRVRGVRLVISDAHGGLKAAATQVLGATAQRCRVHFMRNALAHAGRSGRQVVSALIATAFARADAEAARQQWRRVADQFRAKMPNLSGFMDSAEEAVLAYMTFRVTHRTELHSTDPLERVDGEIKRRTDVVGIFPDAASIKRLVGAILLEQNHEWAKPARGPRPRSGMGWQAEGVQRSRYMTPESIAPIGDSDTVSPPTLVA